MDVRCSQLGSRTAAQLASVVERGYSEDPAVEPKVCECLHIAHVFERADEFDVIHNSFDFLPLTYSELVDTPVLTTIHGFSSSAILPVYQRYNTEPLTWRSAIGSPSKPRLPRDDSPRDRHRGVLASSGAGWLPPFFGRIHPDKGAVEAIEVA